MAVNTHKPCSFSGISQVSKTELTVLYVFYFDIGWLSKHYELLNKSFSANINCLSVIKKALESMRKNSSVFYTAKSDISPHQITRK